MLKSKVSKIEKINSLIKTILVSIALIVSGSIQLLFFTPESSHKIFWLFITGIILLILIEVISKIIEIIIDSSPRLRRVILKEDFIEGLWIDMTENNTYAIINIKYDKGEYIIHGESYRKDGKLLGNWESISSWSSNCKLRCNYKGNYENHISEFDGINEFIFSTTSDSIPNQFSGYYIDISKDNRASRIKGERITEDDLKKINTLKGITDFIRIWADKNSGILMDKSILTDK